MPSAYPSGFDNLDSTKNNATTMNTDHPDHHNDLADAVNAVQGELGLDPAGVEATVVDRLDAIDTSLAGKSSISHTHDLDDLSDVNAPTPAAGQSVVWDGVSEWISQYIPLENLDDVEVSTAIDGDVLTYDDGTNTWVPTTPSGGDPVVGGDLTGTASNAQVVDDSHLHSNSFAFDAEDELPGYNGGTVTGYEGRMLNRAAVMDAPYVRLRNTVIQVGGGLDNEIRQIFFSQASDPGQWLISDGDFSTLNGTVISVASNISPSALQTELEIIYGAGNVSVTQSNGADPLSDGPSNTYDVEFIGALTGAPVVFNVSNFTLLSLQDAAPYHLVVGNDSRLTDDRNPTSHSHLASDISDPENFGFALFTELTDHIDDVTDAHEATAILNTPAGDISATTVQGALDELDTDKSSTLHTHTFRTTHTWPVDGTVTDGILPGIFIDLAANQSAYIVGAWTNVTSGNCDVDIRLNGVVLPDLDDIAASPFGFTAVSPAEEIQTGDYIDSEITNSAAADDLTITVVIEHTVTQD